MHKILRLRDVMAMTGLSRSTLYLRMSEGGFPQSINLDGRAIGWLESEIQQWIQARVSERNRGASLGLR